MVGESDLARLPKLFGGRVINRLYYGAWLKVVLDEQGGANILAFGQEHKVMSVAHLHRQVAALINKKAALA